MRFNLDSLVVKIIVYGVATVFVSLAIFSSIFLISQRSELNEQIIDKGKIFSEFTAKSFYDDYISFYTHSSESNFLIFKNRSIERLDLNPDIVNIALLSVNGRVLFDSSEFESGRYSGEVRTVSEEGIDSYLRNENGAYRELKKNGTSYAEFYVPIKEVGGSHILVMRYTLSFDSFDEQMRDSFWRVGISFIIVFIIVLILSIPVYLSITKPIKRLSDLTRKVKGGDLSVKIDPKNAGKDEIGLLTEDFNAMIEQLRVARDKSDEDNKQLEKKLEEKVREVEESKSSTDVELEKYKKELIDLKEKNKELEKLNQFMVDRELKMVELKKRLDKEG